MFAFNNIRKRLQGPLCLTYWYGVEGKNVTKLKTSRNKMTSSTDLQVWYQRPKQCQISSSHNHKSSKFFSISLTAMHVKLIIMWSVTPWVGAGNTLKIFTFYFFLDLKIRRRSKPCQRRQKNWNWSMVTPLYMGSEGFRSACWAYGKCKKKIKNLNSFFDYGHNVF